MKESKYGFIEKKGDSPGECRPTTEIRELCSANKALEGEFKMIQLFRPLFSSSNLLSIPSLFFGAPHMTCRKKIIG